MSCRANNTNNLLCFFLLMIILLCNCGILGASEDTDNSNPLCFLLLVFCLLSCCTGICGQQQVAGTTENARCCC